VVDFVTGNLLEADAEAVVNTVNTKGVMGKGVALQFKRAFPENYKAYRAACAAGRVQLGRRRAVRAARTAARTPWPPPHAPADLHARCGRI